MSVLSVCVKLISKSLNGTEDNLLFEDSTDLASDTKESTIDGLSVSKDVWVLRMKNKNLM